MCEGAFFIIITQTVTVKKHSWAGHFLSKFRRKGPRFFYPTQIIIGPLQCTIIIDEISVPSIIVVPKLFIGLEISSFFIQKFNYLKEIRHLWPPEAVRHGKVDCDVAFLVFLLLLLLLT